MLQISQSAVFEGMSIAHRTLFGTCCSQYTQTPEATLLKIAISGVN
jgi:hypothetical protein